MYVILLSALFYVILFSFIFLDIISDLGPFQTGTRA